jgi:dTDP-4-dehydrorhamnose reductase
MRILVTGARGMLGTELCAALRPAHEVAGVDLEDFDITDTARTLAALGEAKPEWVIHGAAMTDVDGCERDPDRAFRVNALGTWNVAAACREVGAALIYVSTDFVFDGEKGEAYTEYDAPRPINAYGASKLAGEAHVRELVTRHVIVRSACLFAAHGKNFVRTILAAAEQRSELRVVADQVGSPTYAPDLAAAIARHLVGTPLYGTYHVTNAASASWADLATEALRLAGSGTRVVRISAAEWPSPTRRPKMSVLRRYALELRGADDMRPWQEALSEMLAGSAQGKT